MTTKLTVPHLQLGVCAVLAAIRYSSSRARGVPETHQAALARFLPLTLCAPAD